MKLQKIETRAVQTEMTTALGPVVVIVFAELLCTSLWFSINAATTELRQSLSNSDFGLLTNATQVGFIVGTLASSVSGLADRFPASRIFFLSSVVGAAANGLVAVMQPEFGTALFLRFVVGVSLAGIYPIGMKLVLGWTKGENALTLSLLVGTLALGTALPYGIRSLGAEWSDGGMVVAVCSALCLAGGCLVFGVGDGPYISLKSTRDQGARWGAGMEAFRNASFRSAAFGYFGHMWELYAFWALVPLLTEALLPEWTLNQPSRTATISFIVIAAGAFGCLLSGLISLRWGSRLTAAGALALSGMMCGLIPLVSYLPIWLRFTLLIVWGMAVIADSPQFSNASRNACPPQLVGCALSIQNAIGFAITTVSIWIGTHLFGDLGITVAWLLLPGPVLGLAAMYSFGR